MIKRGADADMAVGMATDVTAGGPAITPDAAADGTMTVHRGAVATGSRMMEPPLLALIILRGGGSCKRRRKRDSPTKAARRRQRIQTTYEPPSPQPGRS